MVPTEKSVAALLQGSHLGMLEYGIAVSAESAAAWAEWLDALSIPAGDRDDAEKLLDRIREKLVAERLRLGGDCYLLPMFVIGYMSFRVVVNTAMALPREEPIGILGTAVADLGLQVTRAGLDELVDKTVGKPAHAGGEEPSLAHSEVLRWVQALGLRILELWDRAEQARADGLPEFSIESGPSWSCFISYNHKDESFASALYEQLREHGVRVWYAPEAVVAGRLAQQVRDAIWRQDKLVVVLSPASLQSAWVRDECRWAGERERETGESILLPISIERSIDTGRWLAEVMGERREVLDFSDYRDGVRFGESVQALVRS